MNEPVGRPELVCPFQVNCCVIVCPGANVSKFPIGSEMGSRG